MAVLDYFITNKGFVQVKAFKDDVINRIYLKLFYRNFQFYDKKDDKSFTNPTRMYQAKSSSIMKRNHLDSDNSCVDRIMDEKFNKQIQVKSFDRSANQIHAVIIEVRQEAGMNLFAVFKDGMIHII